MKASKGKILWADDEIDHLKSHILFLRDRGYDVSPVTNGEDALSLVREERFDLVLLDEMMTGMDGLQVLAELKDMQPLLPVIMITKSEEENLMEEAIGGKIEDYLTKPVNPSQILSSCKRILEKQRIAREKFARSYTSEFAEISDMLGRTLTPDDWIGIHLRLSERELELDQHVDLGLRQTLLDQRRECNQAFGRYIEEHYHEWVGGAERPVLSTDLFARFVAPSLREGRHVLFIVIDNFRLDQWLLVEPLMHDWFNIRRNHYFSIVPTATPYSRNAIFAGLFPRDIEKQFPEYWKQWDDSETSQNIHEYDLLKAQLQRLDLRLKPQAKYIKISDKDEARDTEGRIRSFFTSPLVAMVINFVDILAHKRSDSDILREILPDESAYRSLTRTWFEHSSLYRILQEASREGITVALTTDHGSIRAMRGSTVHADRTTSTNLRYKYGRGIRGENKHMIEIKDPKTFGLPEKGINTNYLIAREDYYFVYTTNYHKYLSLYRDSFQHGGVSLEEMILPFVMMEPV